MKKATRKTDAAITYRIPRDQLEAIRQYCWHGRISIQHFIDCAVAERMRDHKIKVPS